jgi:hypothetical protein
MATKAAAAEQTPKKGDNTPGNNMPLFYKAPAPLDSKKHSHLGLRQNIGFDYAATVNAVPINMLEMPQICHFYPIAFSPDQNATPVAILGLRDKENLFVDKKGQWLEESYIPSYIRRYPFIFSEIPNSDQLTLCVDMDKSNVDEKSQQKFFEKDGKPSLLSQNALEFCKSYHAAAQQTQKFSEALAASGLLVERQAEINIDNKSKINFSGFRIIDEQKLNALSEKDFLEWRRKGWLPFLYAHLFSGGQWQRLSAMLSRRLGAEGK